MQVLETGDWRLMRTQINHLSKREWEVCNFLLQGKSNKQIALALGISESTVEFHLRNVYAKLQVSSRAEAILKLGESTGWINRQLRESIVDAENQKINNSGEFILWKRWNTISFSGNVDPDFGKIGLSYFLSLSFSNFCNRLL